jgi:hypothetical protein
VVQTLTAGTPLISSPTAVLNVLIPLSSNGTAAGTGFSYNITGRGSIQPIATGVAANQLMQDTVEAIHLTISPGSTNFTIAQSNIWWMGMDIEYTPRLTYGDGSRREGRKTETNLGFQEMGPSSGY